MRATRIAALGASEFSPSSSGSSLPRSARRTSSWRRLARRCCGRRDLAGGSQVVGPAARAEARQRARPSCCGTSPPRSSALILADLAWRVRRGVEFVPAVSRAAWALAIVAQRPAPGSPRSPRTSRYRAGLDLSRYRGPGDASTRSVFRSIGTSASTPSSRTSRSSRSASCSGCLRTSFRPANAVQRDLEGLV